MLFKDLLKSEYDKINIEVFSSIENNKIPYKSLAIKSTREEFLKNLENEHTTFQIADVIGENSRFRFQGEDGKRSIYISLWDFDASLKQAGINTDMFSEEDKQAIKNSFIGKKTNEEIEDNILSGKVMKIKNRIIPEFNFDFFEKNKIDSFEMSFAKNNETIEKVKRNFIDIIISNIYTATSFDFSSNDFNDILPIVLVIAKSFLLKENESNTITWNSYEDVVKYIEKSMLEMSKENPKLKFSKGGAEEDAKNLLDQYKFASASTAAANILLCQFINDNFKKTPNMDLSVDNISTKMILDSNSELKKFIIESYYE